MKKVFLLVAAAGVVSFTSCQKAKDKANDVAGQVQDAASDAADTASDVANSASEKAGEVVETVKATVTDAPQIADADLQKLVNQLHDAAVKAKDASEKGEQEALDAAIAEITSLKESLESLKDNADYPKAQVYYEQIQEELQPQQ